METSGIFGQVGKKDLCYCIILLVFIIVACVTFWVGGKGNDIVSYLGFAGTITSIILAVVAIFYAFVQNVSSQQHIGKMQNIMANVDESARNLSLHSESLHQEVGRIGQAQSELMSAVQSQPVSGSGMPTVSHKAYSLREISITGITTFYWLTKTLKSDKASSPKILADLIRFSDAEYIYGLVVGFHFCPLKEMEILVDKDTLRAKKLPAEFSQAVRERLESMVKFLSKSKNEGTREFSKTLQATREKIDAYFAVESNSS